MPIPPRKNHHHDESSSSNHHHDESSSNHHHDESSSNNHERHHERKSCTSFASNPCPPRTRREFCNCVPFAGTGTESNVIFAASTIGTMPNTMEGTIENFSAQPIIVTFTFANAGTVPFTIQPLSSFSFTFANVAQISVAGNLGSVTYNGNFNYCINFTSV